uniref:Protein SPT2 homolog n=1 Tax=Xenopsylla cheopis TaxID=163159 RepID=A0A6M2DCG7_XENCH
MDFGSLLDAAKQNSSAKKEIKYYSTKFSPPKKEQRDKAQLSINIKKFLAKKEEEERQKALEAKRKRDELLAKRDPKLKKKILKHLKVVKSANKSVLEDAIDHDNTAVTLQGYEQPDEDDYGFVSEAASAYHAKIMEKYFSKPEEKKFPDRMKKYDTDLGSIKDRVKAALEREKEEALLPHKRHRRTKAELLAAQNGDTDLNFGKSITDDPEPEKVEEKLKPKPKPKRPMPPPLDYTQLLKLAEQKKDEPIKIEPKVEKKEPERLMTSKERKEYEEMQERMRNRKQRDMERLQAMKNRAKGIKNNENDNNNKAVANSNPAGRIPKLNGYKPKPEVEKQTQVHTKSSISNCKPNKPLKPQVDLKPTKQSVDRKTNGDIKRLPNDKLSVKDKPITPNIKPKPKIEPPNNIKAPKKFPPDDIKVPRKFPPDDIKVPKKFPPDDIKGPKKFPPDDVRGPRKFPPDDLKSSRQFPPKDVKRSMSSKSKKVVANKRRILDDDSEYDSELDDFIDDGPEEGNDYSRYIKDIFGYDKSKYRDEDDDDANMESSFAQVMREEYISKKIGIEEDLRDMEMEAREKAMKAKRKRLK